MTTLADYKFLGPDAIVRKGIAQVFVRESPWLKDLPFIELANNNISAFNQELTDGGATVHAVGDAWTTVNPTWAQKTAGLAIFGDNVDDDAFGSFAAGGQNTMAAKIELKSKGVAQTFNKHAIYGQTTATGSLATTNTFKGLLRQIAEVESSSTTDLDGWLYSGNNSAAHNTQVLLAASNASAALSLVMVSALVDAVPKATHLIMSKLMRRKLQALAQAQGTNLVVSTGKLGEIVTRYGEQIVLPDEEIQDNMDDSSTLVTAIASYDYTQAISATHDTSPIFAVRMGEDGLCGINGVGMIQIEDLGRLESKDAMGKRIKAYLGMRLTNAHAAAVLLNANYAG